MSYEDYRVEVENSSNSSFSDYTEKFLIYNNIDKN